MDHLAYIQEVYYQLSDNNMYEEINNTPVLAIKKKMYDIKSKYASVNVVDKKLMKFLITESPVTLVFYVLPKVHKTLINPPGQPIVGLMESVLISLSFLLDTSDF